MNTPVTDDLGHPVRLEEPARRVVSLVPSLTEAVAASCPDALIGATEWCTHPADLDVARVRGTKNPNVRQIVDLKPDLVIANQEENREVDVRRLRAAGVTVWVTRITTVAEALHSMTRLFTHCFHVHPSWLEQAHHVWAEPTPHSGRTVAVPIWKNPYMWLGTPTYASDVLAHLGLTNVLAGMGRYPHVASDHAAIRRADRIVLPDEPYPFSPTDGPHDFRTQNVTLVEGRWLSWYGPAMVTARAHLHRALSDPS